MLRPELLTWFALAWRSNLRPRPSPPALLLTSTACLLRLRCTTISAPHAAMTSSCFGSRRGVSLRDLRSSRLAVAPPPHQALMGKRRVVSTHTTARQIWIRRARSRAFDDFEACVAHDEALAGERMAHHLKRSANRISRSLTGGIMYPEWQSGSIDRSQRRQLGQRPVGHALPCARACGRIPAQGYVVLDSTSVGQLE